MTIAEAFEKWYKNRNRWGVRGDDLWSSEEMAERAFRAGVRWARAHRPWDGPR